MLINYKINHAESIKFFTGSIAAAAVLLVFVVFITILCTRKRYGRIGPRYTSLHVLSAHVNIVYIKELDSIPYKHADPTPDLGTK